MTENATLGHRDADVESCTALFVFTAGRSMGPSRALGSPCSSNPPPPSALLRLGPHGDQA